MGELGAGSAEFAELRAALALPGSAVGRLAEVLEVSGFAVPARIVRAAAALVEAEVVSATANSELGVQAA